MAWFGSGKKRARLAAELDATRARIEAEQRALLPFAGALSPEQRARLQATEGAWRAALADESGDETQCERALESLGRVLAELTELLRDVARAHPELAARALLAEAEPLIAAIAPGPWRCGAALRLAGAVAELDRDAAPRALERAREHVEAEGGPEHLFALTRLAWTGQAEDATSRVRARAIALLLEGPRDPEWESWRLSLLQDQASAGDADGVRATLAALGDEHHEQALVELSAAELRRGDERAARECLARVRSRALRAEGEAELLVAEARSGRWAEALAGARSLGTGRARVIARLIGLRAARAEHDLAAALVDEIDPDERDEAHLELLEAELDRGDLDAAEARIDELRGDEALTLAWRRLADETTEDEGTEEALARLERVPHPFFQASALERLGWTRFANSDAEGARERFEQALAIAASVARDARAPAATRAWVLLAARLQAALGDRASALACCSTSADPEQRAEGLLEVGRALGAACDLAGLAEVQAELAKPTERSLVVGGALEGLAMLRRLRAAPEPSAER